jgi:sugar phosphate isomerase/epimerase
MILAVSPAYFLSAVGRVLTPVTIRPEIGRIRALGYDGFEVEIVNGSDLVDWERDVRLVALSAREDGLFVPQSVAHFLLSHFASTMNIVEHSIEDNLKRFCSVAAALPGCRTVVVPFGPFVSRKADLSRRAYLSLRSRLKEQLGKFVAIAAGYDLGRSVELQPGALITSSADFLLLCQEMGSVAPGFNFDTGHAHASEGLVELIPARLTDRITGTHLCDNFGGENHSLCPGDGTVPWSRVLKALTASGYSGSYDIEIFCDAAKVDDQYRRGRMYVESILASDP